MGGRCVSHDNQPACPIAPPTPTPTPPPALAPGVVYHWGNGWDCLAGFTAEMSYNATFGLNGAAAPKPGEQFAMTVCRKVGDTWSMLQGAGEIAGGGTLAGGGAVACGTVVLCFVGGGAAAVGGQRTNGPFPEPSSSRILGWIDKANPDILRSITLCRRCRDARQTDRPNRL